MYQNICEFYEKAGMGPEKMSNGEIDALVARLRDRVNFNTAVDPYKLMVEAVAALRSLQGELAAMKKERGSEPASERYMNFRGVWYTIERIKND